jgi:hypothetical protein
LGIAAQIIQRRRVRCNPLPDGTDAPMSNVDFGIITAILLYIIFEVREIRKKVERIEKRLEK